VSSASPDVRGGDLAGPPTLASVSKSADDQTLVLPDGRVLAFRVSGDPGAHPIFVFHGAGLSRLIGLGDRGAAGRAGALVVTVDRPGFGCSDFQPGRRLLDWPTDVAALADHIGVGRFAVAGVSAGGPYAMACAALIPERLTVAAMVAGVGPPDFYECDPMVAAVQADPERALVLARAHCQVMAADIEHSVDEMIVRSPAPDREVYRRADVRAAFVAARQEAFRAGADGPAADVMVINSPWGFDLKDIAADVRLWHGDQDTVTPLRVAEAVAARIPRCSLTIYPGEAHAIGFIHPDGIINDLAAVR
jgi:pimeloyl-ACP methyl ester carboxylesterase